MSLDFAHRVHVNWLLETHSLLRSLNLKPGLSILDAGCGYGLLTLDLARLVGKNGKVWAIDKNPDEIKFLESQKKLFGFENNIQTAVQSLEAPMISPGKFDITILRFVASALDNPREVLKNLTQSLKPGGKLGIFDYFASKPEMFPENAFFSQYIDSKHEGQLNTFSNHAFLQRVPEVLDSLGYERITIKPIVNMDLRDSRISSTLEDFKKEYPMESTEHSILLSPIYCQITAELKADK